MLEHRQSEAGHGRIVAVAGQVHAEPVGEQVGAPRPRHQPAAVLAFDERRLLALLDVVREGAGKRGKHALLYFVSDRTGGAPHVAKGMIAEITVR